MPSFFHEKQISSIHVSGSFVDDDSKLQVLVNNLILIALYVLVKTSCVYPELP